MDKKKVADSLHEGVGKFAAEDSIEITVNIVD